MKLFEFNKNNDSNLDSDNGILGLKHLEEFTEPISNPKNLENFEWRRRLKSKTENRRFKLNYYGDLHTQYNNLIVSSEFAPQKIVIIDIESNEEILIFDGCKHGYNAMLCDEFTNEQIELRETNKTYHDKSGNREFEIIISAYYQIDYEEEFREEVDSDGRIELINGERIKFEELKRNGCDHIRILGINKDGEKIEILSEELS